MAHIARKGFRFLASYGLSCILFLLLLALTYLGTLYQTEHGLYAAQQKYFNSLALIHYAFGALPAPLPGARLLMPALFVNLLLGGIVHAGKSWSKIGIITVHAGILLLLAGSFVTYTYAVSGNLTLYEGQQSRMFESETQWELAVAETGVQGPVTEYVIHDSDLNDAQTSEGILFGLGDVPFQLRVAEYGANAAVRSGGSDLARMPQGDATRDVPGAYVSLVGGADSAGPVGVVWGRSESPLVLESGGRRWRVELRRRRWELPFAVTLKKFTREVYPGTEIPKTFRSDVTKTENDVRQDVAITMNEPLREAGYTLYQSSYGPQGLEGGPVYSVLAVVKNPADQFPLYACVAITLGLALHFGQRLLRYLQRESSGAKAAMAVIALAALVAGDAAQAQAQPAWDAETLDLLATLPVQDEGRVKPLDTFAAVRLLRFNGKRSATNAGGKLVQPIEWMADCLFYPERAKQSKTFRLDNSDVAVALGMTFQRKRDRYSYAELEPARDRLIQLVREYSGIPQERRNTVQNQLINLAQNLLEFENLCNYLTFARTPAAVPPESPAAQFFPGEREPRLSVVLGKAAQIRELGGKDASRDKGLETYLEAVYESVSGATLRLIPPSAAGETEWLTPEAITQQAFGPAPAPAHSLDLIRLLEDAALNPADPAKIAAFHSAVTVQAAGRADCAKIGLEVKFHRLKLFYYSLVVFVLGFLAVTVSWLAPRSRVVYAAGVGSVLAAAMLLGAGITMRCIIRGRPPVTTLYETILFATLVAVGVAIFMEVANRRRIMLGMAAVLGTLGMFLANKYEIREGADTMPSMVAVLDTNFWLATHVTTITMGYGAGFLASAIAHLYIVARALRLKAKDPVFYRQLARMTYGVLCFSLLFTIVGTVLGGIWANESWGRFWGWDPKENGALMIVLWQLAILHARLGGYIKDFGIALASVFTGVIVAFSWFGVNLLGVGLHSYGFTSGTYKVLLGFYAIEGCVLLLGAAVWPWEDKKRELKPEKECR